jgi:hypothetical protein
LLGQMRQVDVERDFPTTVPLQHELCLDRLPRRRTICECPRPQRGLLMGSSPQIRPEGSW